MLYGLAIDPGTVTIGYCRFLLKGNVAQLLHYGDFQTKGHLPIEYRLQQIYHFVDDLIKAIPVHLLITENSFYNPRFPAGITVREGLGVIKLAAAENHVPIHLFRPDDPKNMLVGKKNANKLEVAKAVEQAKIPLPLPASELVKQRRDHITDSIGLALSYCFLQSPTLTILDEKGAILCSGLEKKTSGTTGKSKAKKSTKTGNLSRKTPMKMKKSKPSPTEKSLASSP